MIPDRKLIEKELAERGLYPYISVYETVDSTITRARSLISEHDGDILIVASSQTQGKGSHGRKFYSPQDTGLYFTAVYRDVSPAFPVTFAAGIASVRALHNFGIETSVKWVNDIYYDRMKAGGILCERTGSGEVIVGIGINLQEPEGGFPEEISGIAKAIGKDTLSRDLLAAAIYSELTEEIRSDPAGVIERYRAVCDTVGRKISFVYDNKEMRGTALSVEDDGALSVMTEEGAILRFETGNVSIRYMDQQR